MGKSKLPIFMVYSKNQIKSDEMIKSEISKRFDSFTDVEFNATDDTDVMEKEIRTKSLISPNKVIHFKYTLKDLSRKVSVAGKRKKKKVTLEEFIVSLFKEAGDNILIFLYPDSMDKRKSLQKFVADSGTIIEVKEPTEKDIRSFINTYVKSKNASIKPDAIDYIFSSVTNDLLVIRLELDKLLLLTDKITLKDAMDIVIPSSEIVIFDIIDAIGRRNRKKAFELINRFMQTNDNIFVLVSLFQRSFRIMFYTLTNGKSLENHFHLNKFVIEKYVKSSKLFSERKIVKNLIYLLQLECDLKSGASSKNAVYDMILTLTKG